MFTHLLQIASLLAVLLAGGLLLLWRVRREMVLAGQKTSFVANVSHELKTPLTSIRMYAEMLGGAAGDDPGQRGKYVGVILAESERLSRLIANVLDFSRMEEGKKRYRPETFPLQEVLQEIAEAWGPTLSEQGMDLRIEAPSQPLTATVDRDALVQVLQNLLVNAGKYAAAGGEVILAASAGPAGDIILRVLDRGPGVPPSMREKIFRKFQRGDDRLTAETTGAGLGLAIARNLLRDQGGDLTCHSRPGGGAEFRVVLPPA
jgi:signal transduction histidine kinase